MQEYPAFFSGFFVNMRLTEFPHEPVLNPGALYEGTGIIKKWSLKQMSLESVKGNVPTMCIAIAILCFAAGFWCLMNAPYIGFGLYFFAKGIFCPATLYILANK